MNALEIANKLVELCKQGRNAEAIVMYAPDAVSVEPFAPPPRQRESRGVEAIKAKGKWWTDNHTVHSAVVAGPWPHGDRFIVGFKYDVTMKASGQRFQMEEMALYTTENGKIVREEFFYAGMA